MFVALLVNTSEKDLVVVLFSVRDMLHHCCVPGCTSNSSANTEVTISFHSFPRDRALAHEWIVKICRGANFLVNDATDPLLQDPGRGDRQYVV